MEWGCNIVFEEFEEDSYVENLAADVVACSVGQTVAVVVDIDHERIEAAMRIGWCSASEEHHAAAEVDYAAVVQKDK